jgi:hypothetical protein
MSRNDSKNDLQALRRLISEAHTTISTTKLPENRTVVACETLSTALALADDLILRPSPAVALGTRGGMKTAKRGSAYFSKIAKMRKTRAGGRPKGK